MLERLIYKLSSDPVRRAYDGILSGEWTFSRGGDSINSPTARHYVTGYHIDERYLTWACGWGKGRAMGPLQHWLLSQAIARYRAMVKPVEGYRLVVMLDDGEHDPHEAEQCGTFASKQGVRAYVQRRFGNHEHFQLKKHGSSAELTWLLIDKATGKDSDLLLLVWTEDLYSHP